MKITTLILMAFINVTIVAQGWAEKTRFNTGTWTTLNVRYSPNSKIHLFVEGQIRSQKTYDDFNYWELKGIFHYNISDQFFVGGGLGNYHQYLDYENFGLNQKQAEVRVWAEIGFKNTIKRLNFDHRYRVEQRFIHKWNDQQQVYIANYKNGIDEDRYRFRYRLQLNVPINHATMTKNTFYFNISNEIHMTHKKPFFTQNRFFAGVGFKFNHSMIQVGCMHQFLNGNNFERRKDYAQIIYSYVIPKLKAKKSN